jgi:hypothetical protein
MDNYEQKSVMTFLFLQGKKSKAICDEFHRVLREAAVSLARVKHRYRRFKDGSFSVDDEFRSGRPRHDIRKATSQFLSQESSLSAGGFAKKLAASLHAMKEILTCDLEMKNSPEDGCHMSAAREARQKEPLMRGCCYRH